MKDSEQVPMVGGPKDGDTYPWSTASRLLIPDARDMKQKVTADGVVTIFGEHTYQLNCYAKSGQEVWRWEYVGYEPPK